MRKTFWDKRIPSFLGLIFLAISVGIVSWFSRNYTQLRGRASVGETPNEVQISNITNTSFTLSYFTQEEVIGIINYGRDSKLDRVGLDDRDQTGKSSPRRVHYITISRLDPDTKYYFTIQSGAMEFRKNNQPYEVTTAAKSFENSPSPASVTGSVNLPDGTIPIDGIAYLSTSASQLLSTPLKIDGTYIIPLNSLLTSDLTSNAPLESDTVFQMTIGNAVSRSHVLVKAVNTNPVPLITLSKDYDFTIDTSLTSLTASQEATASPSGAFSPFPTLGFPLFTGKSANMPAILTPEEGQKFTDQQPLFQGSAAKPNAIVVINFDSAQGLQNSLNADKSGNWQFRPTTPFSPGVHSISIQTLDASGIKQTIKRSFTVLADGSQFTEPSVSPTLEPTTSPSPTTVKSTPTNIPPTSTPTTAYTPSPTIISTITSQPSPTTLPTSTLIPTTIPTTITSFTPVPTKPIAPPGSPSLLIGGFLAALSLTAGFMLFFLL